MKEKVEAVLAKIRPRLEADGGGIELVDVVDGVVRVRLQGACQGCMGARMTLKMGVEAHLMKNVPGVTEVIQA